MSAQTSPRRPDRPRSSRWRRLLPVALAALFVLLGAFNLLGRLALAGADEYADVVAARLGEALGADVRIGALHGRWLGWDPVLEVRAFELAPPGAAPAIRVASAYLELDVLETLLRRRPVAHALVITDARVMLQVRQDGSIGLLGGQGGQEPPVRAAVNFLYDSDYVELVGASVRIVDPQQRISRLAFDGRLDNSALRHLGWLNVQANLADGAADPQSASGLLQYDLRGHPYDFPTLRGELLVDIRDIEIGVLAARLGGDERSLSGRVERLRLRSEFTAPGTDLRATLTAPRLQLEGRGATHIDGVLLTVEGWMLNESGGDLRLAEASARIGERDLDMSGLQLHWRQLASDTYWFARLPDLEAGALMGLAVDLEVGDARLQRWLDNLSPQGRVSAGRFWLDPQKRQFALSGQVSDADIDAYRGVPMVRDADGDVVLFEGGGWVDLDTGPFYAAFPNVFAKGRNYDSARGRVAFTVDGGTLHMRSGVIELNSDLGSVFGELALFIPPERSARRLHLLVGVRDGVVDGIPEYLPVKLNAPLQDWVRRAMVDGRVSEGALLISGPMIPSETAQRVLSVFARFEGASVDYASAWPAATDLDGSMLIEGGRTSGTIASGRLAGMQLDGGTVEVVDAAEGRSVALRGRGRGDAQRIIDFMRNAPLGERIEFLDAGWKSRGSVDFDFDLGIPLDAGASLRTRIEADLRLAELQVPQGRLQAQDVSGHLSYAEPGLLTSENLQARLFNGPSALTMRGDWSEGGPGLEVAVDGEADGAAVARWIDAAVLHRLSGRLPYTGQVAVDAEGKGTEIMLRLEPEQLVTGWPAPLALADQQAPLHLAMTVRTDRPWPLELVWPRGSAHLRMTPDGTLARGLLRFGEPETEPFSPTSLPDQGLRVRGQVDGLDVGAWVDAVVTYLERDATGSGGDGRGGSLLVDLAAEVDGLRWNSLELGRTWMTMTSSLDEADIGFEADMAAGRVRIFKDDRPLSVELERLRFEAPAAGSALDASGNLDLTASALPLDLEPGELPEFELRTDELIIGDESLGAFGFHATPRIDGLTLDRISANLRGLTVRPEDGSTLQWRMVPAHQSRFTGRLSGGNLNRILPRWGYAPTVACDDFEIDADLAWNGPPDLFELAALDGRASVVIDDGAFVEVEGAGAIRVVGLFNLAALARRMRLDFSDLVTKGIAFDEVEGTLRFAHGTVSTPEPVSIVGPGSSFEATGSIDLVELTMDAEIVVTLPLSKNLPWYAASAAVLNPLAGAGVFVAQQVFKDQIDRYSTAAYRVRGPVAEPEVELLAVLDEAANESPEAAEADPEGSETVDDTDQDKENSG